MRKKLYISIIIVAVVLAAAIFGYCKWVSPTKIAFVNYQAAALGKYHKLNNNSWIKVKEVSIEDLSKLSGYDMVFVNGMGLRIVEEQRAQLRKIAEKGIPIYTSMATNPDNDICNLDTATVSVIKKYIGGGSKKNYRSLLNYVRKYIDGKKVSVYDPEPPVEQTFDIIYHPYLGNDDSADDPEFNSVADYESWLKKENLWHEGASKIVITGQIVDPRDLILALEKAGMNVYPVAAYRKLQEYITEINPDMVINLPHGRMGDDMVQWLEARNILLITPLTVTRLVDEWESDPMGMSGGFLSQSVAMPEIDGGIRSFALFAQYKDKEGYQHSFAVPERLETFVETVKNYLALKTKPNSEKRVAIYYYKGAGHGAVMSAGGMEVAPSLYNLLKRLKAEGYKVDNLPANHKEFEKMIMEQGAVLGVYAEGAIAEFMKKGNPLLISKQDYEAWVAKSLRPDKYKEVVDANGEFPGQYMATADGKLGIARVQFGNVVVLPQNAAGSGTNAFKILHGTDAAPPHPYIASYLWTRYGFGADVLMHFGTHGSLEFTPHKQIALSSNDWPDRLVGPVPHVYIYTIGNVGEGIIAKRRSYATLTSYLTPPFLESNVRGLYRELTEALKIYNNDLEDYTAKQSKNKTSPKPSDKSVPAELQKASLAVKRYAVKLGIHRDLELDSVLSKPYTEQEIRRIENFAEEIATEKITGQLYTMGVPYEPARITSSVFAMATDPIAYSLWSLDKIKKRTSIDAAEDKALFTKQYLNPAREIVGKLLKQPSLATDEFICRTAKITADELRLAREYAEAGNRPRSMMAAMMGMSGSKKGNAMSKGMMTKGMTDGGKQGNMLHAMSKDMPKGQHPQNMPKQQPQSMGGSMPQSASHPVNMPKDMPKSGKSASAAKPQHPADMGKKAANAKGAGMPSNMMAAGGSMPEPKNYSKQDKQLFEAILEIERTVKNVGKYRQYLTESPEAEMRSNINALAGGYTSPSPGGDPIANPNSLPTGRNLYSINAEATPSEAAWDKGMKLANNTIRLYRERHNGEYPRKVAYTLWSGEFIETEGATIAQILYMLGVEPIRDAFGRVSDIRLIPSAELGRPRIDVVVQTSGQLRDLAASRLFLVNRAVEMAAEAKNDEYDNLVAKGVAEAQRTLLDNGLSPKEAKEIATYRVFGGLNGNYGTGIQGMVESGDRWEKESEIADTYINNMGAFYGSEKNWEQFRKFAFRAALTRTDVVIQPRQSNTWGALSLDHVYEFMGGINLAARNVTGKDPDAYLSDYRNRSNVRMQEVKEAIGVEARTTILNPTYIKEKMKGEASSAAVFAETVRNTYAWNVMKPAAIDNELWDEIYNVYVKDKFDLGVKEFFEKQNPATMQEITAVMLETVRKGYWKATDEQIRDIVAEHTRSVKQFSPSCSGFVCDNAKLKDFIASHTDPATAKDYKQSIAQAREVAVADKDAKNVVLQKDNADNPAVDESKTNSGAILLVMAIAIAVLLVTFVIIRKRKK